MCMKKDKVNPSVQPDFDCGIYEEKESLPYPNPISKHQTDINIGWMRAMKYMESHPVKEITDEEIEKKFPTNLKILCEIHKIPVNFNFEQGEHLDMICRINTSKQTGAKWMRNKMNS